MIDMLEEIVGGPFGARVTKRERVAPRDMIAAFASLPVANVSDCMARMFAGGARIRPFHRAGRLCGPALTVRTRPGDNLAVHLAIDLAVAGDVIVVDAGGDLTNAIVGELMVRMAIHKGIAGFVINGAIRDSEAIASGLFPVFAAGVSHRGPYKDGPGEINQVIAIEGMAIGPGDVIIGDGDGFLAVALNDADRVLRSAQAKHAAEAQSVALIDAGGEDRRWVIEGWHASAEKFR